MSRPSILMVRYATVGLVGLGSAASLRSTVRPSETRASKPDSMMRRNMGSLLIEERRISIWSFLANQSNGQARVRWLRSRIAPGACLSENCRMLCRSYCIQTGLYMSCSKTSSGLFPLADEVQSGSTGDIRGVGRALDHGSDDGSLNEQSHGRSE